MGGQAAQGRRLDEAGGCRTRSPYPRDEQQGALGALLQSSRASSTLDGTLGRTGPAKSVRHLEEAYCQESNRLVRTRMGSSCGTGPGNAGPYPDALMLGFASTVKMGFLQ